MPHRNYLLSELELYIVKDDNQIAVKNLIIDFVKNNHDCFLRSKLSGHITCSSWLVSPDESEVLLTHHKKIGEWLQLGGHADGDSNVLAVAIKEAEEESGINSISVLNPHIFDVDVHWINDHKGIAGHYHYDIRFMLKAPHKNWQLSDESHELKWMPIKEIAEEESFDISLRRMAQKFLSKLACTI